jgi:hypothetical protein
VTLFKKGKGEAAPAPKAPVFSPIDRNGLLGLLDQVVNSGQSGVLELHEPRGNWVYAFQGGALTHASGGRVRGARQAFDLLWEFQSGEFLFTPRANPNLAGNLYIDKTRLLDLLRRSQAVLQGPSAPYIPPDQQRPIAPVNRPYSPPAPGQMPPAWQPGAAPNQYQAAPPQGWPAQPAPAWGAAGVPQQPGYPPQPGYPAQYPAGAYPGAPAPAPGQYPPQAYPQPPAYPAQPPMPPQGPPPQMMPPQAPPPMMPQGPPPQMMPPGPPPQMMPPQAARPAPARPVAPSNFSVPPMALPKKREPTYQPPAAAAPAPAVQEPAKPAAPQDDLAALRASLVAQAPPVRPAPTGPAWGVRSAEGTVAPPPAANVKAAGKTKGKKAKGDSKLMAAIKVQLIKFLLWACERRYTPEDHWTLKDAFEVSTMELRDQFIGAFSQTLKSQKKDRVDDDDMDDMAAGRMRGRARRH